ncbi:MAG: dihydrofolate reductase family protein [Arachnia propionica]|uniref:dihydrofolate reductase family protein n=1 Tax=Arachnia propionica TaxID=1750 RepID=UPI0026F66B03|nr:dihydrofolate reductase family protein [Arachnia propionica]
MDAGRGFNRGEARPGWLIKRFGSRKGILQALSNRWLSGIPKEPLGLASPREELREWAHRRFGLAGARGVGQGLVQLVTVLPTSLLDDTDHVTVARTLNEAVTILNESQAREVHVDGGKTVQSFLRAGLIDEITVFWAPVLIGKGRRLFDALDDDVLLTLQGSHTTETGMVGATYLVTPARSIHTHTN